MRSALVWEAPREGYGIEQMDRPMTVGELMAILEDYDEDALVILSHDRGYTYGSIHSYPGYYEENEDGEWEEM